MSNHSQSHDPPIVTTTVISRPIQGRVLPSGQRGVTRIEVDDATLEVGATVFVHASVGGHGTMATGTVAARGIVTLPHDFKPTGTRVWIRPAPASGQTAKAGEVAA
jgi:hypothetical protein